MKNTEKEVERLAMQNTQYRKRIRALKKNKAQKKADIMLFSGCALLFCMFCFWAWCHIIITLSKPYMQVEAPYIASYNAASVTETPESVIILPQITDVPLTSEVEQRIIERVEFYTGQNPYLKDKLTVELVLAVIQVESRGREGAISIDPVNGNCIGLMQLNERYTQDFIDGAGIQDVYNTLDNIDGGIWRLAYLIEKYEDVNIALMCYNMGETKALKYLAEGVTETRYTQDVLYYMYI